MGKSTSRSSEYQPECTKTSIQIENVCNRKSTGVNLEDMLCGGMYILAGWCPCESYCSFLSNGVSNTSGLLSISPCWKQNFNPSLVWEQRQNETVKQWAVPNSGRTWYCGYWDHVLHNVQANIREPRFFNSNEFWSSDCMKMCAIESMQWLWVYQQPVWDLHQAWYFVSNIENKLIALLFSQLLKWY